MANILKEDKIVTSDGNTTVDLANIQATGGAGSVNNTSRHLHDRDNFSNLL